MEKRSGGWSGVLSGSGTMFPRSIGITSAPDGPYSPGVSQVERVPVRDVAGVVRAREVIRERARALGFSSMDATALAAVTSELARNILQYAGEGTITVAVISAGRHLGILIIADDDGPGIRSIRRALQPGWSSSGGLGMGLAGARRIMDELEIDSAPQRGTRVQATLWRRW